VRKGVGDGSGVEVGKGVDVIVGDGKAVRVGKAVGVAVGDGSAVEVGEGVGVIVGDGRTVRVGEAVGVAVADGSGVDVGAGVDVIVGDGSDVKLGPGVAVAVDGSAGVKVGEGVAVGEGGGNSLSHRPVTQSKPAMAIAIRTKAKGICHANDGPSSPPEAGLAPCSGRILFLLVPSDDMNVVSLVRASLAVGIPFPRSSAPWGCVNVHIISCP